MRNDVARAGDNTSEKRRVAIVVTTIFQPDFLSNYANNILEFGHEDHTTIYVVGDRKTPESCGEEAARQRTRGVNARYLSLAEQERYMARFPDLAAEIPVDSDNRRNVGFIMAVEEGADVIVSIDDDNYCLPGVDFVGGHLQCGLNVTESEAIGTGGWFNICSLLEVEPCGELLYPRGFPYALRGEGTGAVVGPASGRVAINVGLWQRDPDVDAIGRLYGNPQVGGLRDRSVLLAAGVRSPINTQNTALTREAMAAYYYVRMGTPLRGMKIDRFGDIFSGYFAQWCADSVGERVRVGSPMVDHRRNRHNLLVDLWHELAGIMMLEDLAAFLTQPAERSASYPEAYRLLSRRLEEVVHGLEGFIWTDESRDYFRRVGSNMRTWVDVYEEIAR
jgi:hypothetical protein